MRELPTPLAEKLSTAHACDSESLITALDTHADDGLDHAEAAARLAQYGPNALAETHRKSLLSILFEQVRSPVVWLLIAACILSLVFGDLIDSAAIFIVLLINTLIGFMTEWRAIRSMDALRMLTRVTARVSRGSQELATSSENLVPGDIILLDAGDIVPADVRLIRTSGVTIDESPLTGESVPTSKHSTPVAHDAPIAEHTSMAFKGTAITNGVARGVVIHTGMDTQIGRISSLVAAAAPERTPLEDKLTRLGEQLIFLTLAVATLVAITGWMRGEDLLLMIQAGIALAVAAIPEGLPIVATLALARGMWRMAQQNAIVERLAAVETLGATTLICTDKTGTLTENQMTVSELWTPSARINMSQPSDTELTLEDTVAVSEIMSLCNNARIGDTPDSTLGDPMEVGLLRAAKACGNADASNWRRRREVAFDTNTRMMATIDEKEGALVAHVKGAPEAVLEHCSFPVGSTLCEEWRNRAEELAQSGYRVLAAASRNMNSPDDTPYADLTLQGLIALRDPPRSDIPNAIAACHRAGIRVVMMTGDHVATACNIAASTGLTHDDPHVIEGKDLKPLEDMTKAEREIARQADIFARVSPAQKLDLVTLHQQAGEIVAMTGDGVNDAPALKKADIGVAMGLRGTQVAREAAAMILRDDAFTTIVTAVREGRVIFRNIQRFVSYLLSCNLSEVLLVGFAVGFGLSLPLLPLHILFLNLVTDIFPAFALGMGAGDDSVLERHPRAPEKPILTRQIWRMMCGQSVVIALSSLGAMLVAQHLHSLSHTEAMTVSFLTLAMSQLWHVFNMRHPAKPLFRNDVIFNPYIWGALAICIGLLMAALYIPFLANVLTLTPPSKDVWILIFLFSLIPLVIGQVGITIAAKLHAASRSGPEGAAKVAPVPVHTETSN